MTVINFDLEDGLPKISLTVKPDEALRFMKFLDECQSIKNAVIGIPISDDAADARRYRWLRNEVKDWYIGPSFSTYNDVVVEGKYLDLSAGGVALDSAIDAAMKGGEA